ncbi:tetratricopeptide repeat protein [Xanthomonas sp. NCPPB 2654]|uniref:tetratricopeptide repeat protein n=1 Tax=unclassified Xanthomonas TaxID=2643310 RepID=UPI0021E062F3|nr:MULTISPECIES: tetratricopeptide repeat protein [unclassified Xanthomonas]MDL5364008.1 tetratricopeptide repeat protein [Xanthomonas sp. NCPPB 2654]UYC20987.1 tetratricopeptide repeat protein [Xanthomonas sp. CFBP 8443]
MNALLRARSLVQAIYQQPQRWDANLAEAEALLRDALRTQPHDPELLTGLGTVLCDLGRHDEAASVLRQALKRGSRDRNTCFNLGVALRNGAGRRHASLYFAKAAALQASPRSWEAYFDAQAQ